MADKDFEWLTPLLGFVGLLAGSLFLTSSGQYNTPQNNNLPPPPAAAKPGGCGCSKPKA